MLLDAVHCESVAFENVRGIRLRFILESLKLPPDVTRSFELGFWSNVFFCVFKSIGSLTRKYTYSSRNIRHSLQYMTRDECESVLSAAWLNNS